MGRLVIDPTLQAQLKDGGEILEICDTAGRVLGHYVPVPDPAAVRNREPKIGDEEIKRRLSQGGGRDLAAILADLKRCA